MTEENRNALVQRNDRLIRDVIQKAEKECKSAVALIAMYGSFCTGRYSETSDLDLFVLMRNEDGYKACVTFILDGIGMDFYGVKWEWLEEEANYTTPYLAKLLDSKIVYCPENADRERFEALREKAQSILTAPYTEDDLHRAEAMFDEAERLFAKLMRERAFAQSRKYAAGLLNCLFGTICVLNKQVFKLSVRDRFTELEQMRFVPRNFKAVTEEVIRAGTVKDLRTAAEKLMRAADDCFAEARAVYALKAEKKEPTPDDLKGTLEEMVSNWQHKIHRAAKEKDVFSAFDATANLQYILDEIGENFDIPAFDLLEKFDAKDLSAAAAQFDGALSLYAKEYEKAGLKPNVFDSIEAFEKMYLG